MVSFAPKRPRSRVARRVAQRALCALAFVISFAFFQLPAANVFAWEGTEWASGSTTACSASTTYTACSGVYGAPDSSLTCTGYGSAIWSSVSGTTTEWLRVFFDFPLYATGVVIYENITYGRWIGLELEDTTGAFHTITVPYDDTTCSTTGGIEQTVTFPRTSYQVRGVKLYLGTFASRAGIDAVGLIGSDEPSTPTPTVTPTPAVTSTPGPTSTPAGPIEVIFPTPTPIDWGDEPEPVSTPDFGAMPSEAVQSLWGTSFGVVSTNPLRVAIPSVKVPVGASNVDIVAILLVILAGFAVYLFVRLFMQLLP